MSLSIRKHCWSPTTGAGAELLHEILLMPESETKARTVNKYSSFSASQMEGWDSISINNLLYLTHS